jgi:transposase-like protein
MSDRKSDRERAVTNAQKAAALVLDEDVEVRAAAERYGVSSSAVSQAKTRLLRERASKVAP